MLANILLVVGDAVRFVEHVAEKLRLATTTRGKEDTIIHIIIQMCYYSLFSAFSCI
jgi:hypothetical protein